MLAVISPLPLAVEEKDFMLVGVDPKGKHAYFNTRWVRENHPTIFDGEDYGKTLVILKNEISKTNDLASRIADFTGEDSTVLTLTIEEVPEFIEFYKLTKRDAIFNVLAKTEYEEGVTVSEVILQQCLDVMMKLYRKGLGGK